MDSVSDECLYRSHFYYVLVGDLDNLKKEIEKNKNLLTEKDSLGRTLLYLATFHILTTTQIMEPTK